MPSNYLILCHPLLLLPSIFPSIRVFSNESALLIRWPKYWSFSFHISPSNEHPGLISFRMDWLDLLAVQGTLRSLLQHHSSKASILWCSAFFIVQLSHPLRWGHTWWGEGSSDVMWLASLQTKEIQKEHHAKWTQIRVIHLHVQELQGLPTTPETKIKAWNSLPWSLQREHSPADTISWPPEPSKNKCLLLTPPSLRYSVIAA